MINLIRKTSHSKRMSWFIVLGCLVFVGEAAFAGQTIGNMASSITNTFTNLTKLITAGSYLAGLGFSIGAIMKFKQHKDNPQQMPIGTPIALVFIASALLFLPTILTVAGYTMFGSGGGRSAGPTGSVFSGS
jgi:intracellular multiplication protein IcmD